MGTRRIRVLIAATSVVLLAASVTWAVKGPYTSTRFGHKQHLHKALVDPTSDAANAECLSCHGVEQRDKDTGRLTVSRFDNCKDCHAAEKTLDKVELKTERVKAAIGAFNHGAHDAQRCADCHGYDPTSDTFSMRKDILTAVCKVCHNDHDTSQARFAGTAENTCSRCHMNQVVLPLTAARKGSFDHRTHLPKSPRREDCAVCHAGVEASKDLREGVTGVVTAACARCHVVDKGAAPIAVEPRYEPRKRFFTEFAHDIHVRTMDCGSCHKLEPSGKFSFAQAGLPDYEGCVDCHYHKSWKVTDHGKVIQCGQCHQGAGAGGDPAAIRQVEVTKRDLGPVRFAAVDHPFVSPEDLPGLPAGQDCARCHVRGRADMASRIQVKAFSHRAHLGEQRAKEAARGTLPARETCLGCHGALTAAKTPAESKAFDLARDCAQCHRGDPGVAVPASRTVAVPVFSHESHLAAQNPRIRGCESCHGYDLAADRMVTPPDVLSCKRCHDHKENADVTGQDLDKCILCHTGDSLFRPGVMIDVAFERAGAMRFGAIFHDQTTKACSQCHAPEGGVEVQRKSVKTVAHKNDPHRGRSMDSCGQCHAKMRKDE